MNSDVLRCLFGLLLWRLQNLIFACSNYLIKGGVVLPHVVLNGKVAVENIFKELKPLMIRNKNGILKTTDVYLEREKNVILIDSLAIEADKKTVFLAMISGRDDGVVVRLYPKIDVEKTEGVKKILVELGKQLIAMFPEFKIGETNLDNYLK
jgi:hypothetical protein